MVILGFVTRFTYRFQVAKVSQQGTLLVAGNRLRSAQKGSAEVIYTLRRCTHDCYVIIFIPIPSATHTLANHPHSMQ